MSGTKVDIGATWSVALQKLIDAESEAKESEEQLKNAEEAKEKALSELNDFIEKLNENGFLDSLEEGRVLDSIFCEKIKERDARLEFLSKGGKRVFDELYKSFVNVIESRTEKHKDDLMAALN